MSDLSDPIAPAIEPERLADLRHRAASRLTGPAATKGPPASAVDALSVLHALASSPETATDALTLLHELQVHQVELDLQAQEVQESRADLEAALRRQIELYDALPVGCFTLDARRVMHEFNPAGAAMLGTGRAATDGLLFDTCLGAAGASRLRAAIARIDAGSRHAACRLTLLPKEGPERQVLASIGPDPGASRYVVSLAYADDDEAQRPAR